MRVRVVVTIAAVAWPMATAGAAGTRATADAARASSWSTLVRRVVAPLWQLLASADSATVAAPAATPLSPGVWESGRARARWFLPDSCVGRTARLVRLVAAGNVVADSARVDGHGVVDLGDSTVSGPARLAYRLDVPFDRDTARSSPEWIDLPARASRRSGIDAALRPSLRGGARSVVARFALARPGPARFELFDAAGRRIAVQFAPALDRGRHTLTCTLDADLAPGAYFARLDADGVRHHLRLVRR